MEGSPAGGRAAATAPALPAEARSSAGHPRNVAAVVLAGLTVLSQIAQPLLGGRALQTATVVSVLLFAAASLLHAAAGHGAAVAVRVLAVAGGTGLVAEAIGVAAGFPFGRYAYGSGLGPRLLGVPLLVPLAWTMMAYPAVLLGRRLASGRPARVALAAWTLAAWDFFLDPQMVASGHWAWAHPAPALPGVPGIPLTNYAGWALVALVMATALDRALPAGPGAGPATPVLLLGWTWLGSAVGNLVFFGRPAVAAWGGVVMGVTVLPYLLSVLRGPGGSG